MQSNELETCNQHCNNRSGLKHEVRACTICWQRQVNVDKLWLLTVNHYRDKIASYVDTSIYDCMMHRRVITGDETPILLHVAVW